MRTSDFDYELPEELIAQRPMEPRDHSRLMVVNRATGAVEHRIFRDLPGFLQPGDALILNDTRVMPARLFGVKAETGGRVEVLLVRRLEPDMWEALVRPGRRVLPGTVIRFGDGQLEARVEDRTDAGGRRLRFSVPEAAGDSDPRAIADWIARLGQVPLPPYIKEQLDDPERYQTVYAREEGSAAAPTAGLHFTPELLAAIEAKGVRVAHLTLHVGLGTFRPVQTETVEEHRMHTEYFRVSGAVAEAVALARREGRRVVAVGTTAARALESAAGPGGTIGRTEGWTNLFIYPGYRWKVVDGLITNFHLPRTTLLMLVAALLGRERTLAVYRQAVEARYRFFSFGDAMLIL
ncbi:MAG: tRNA preQ1(34) S-adenosylmethionine ribosyltransferase-isomerase QueA [Firmicutes bacterium]|nr:tRNA preQ1(34) S-adenosylmethionine ribosyltransferase-isomerase QueA [Bacillota bacterium]